MKRSKEEQQALDDEAILIEVFSALADKMTERRIVDEYDLLPIPIRDFAYVYILDAEIKNGGFNQFFFNTDGATIPQTEAAVEAICGEPQLGLFKKAVNRFLPKRSVHAKIRSDAKTQDDVVNLYSKHATDIDFENLDSDWYNADSDTMSATLAFIKQHKDVFIRELPELKQTKLL